VDFDPERLVPLYRLKPHTIGQSYGLAVARRLGLPEVIVAAAEAVLPAGASELAEALRRLEEERERLRAQLDRLRERDHQLAEREQEAAATIEGARNRAEAERDRLRREGGQLLEQVRREGAELMADLRTGAKGKRELTQTVSDARTRLDRVVPPAASPVTEADEPLKVGDDVELGDIRGELIALDAGKAVVGRGGLRIEVAPERLRRARKLQPTREPKFTVSLTSDERDELNLVGMRTAEALRKLEEFLDQAYLATRPEVRVIHGIGSGALKKAVHEYLSTSPYCTGFRQAEPHHGGAGATIVQLNQ